MHLRRGTLDLSPQVLYNHDDMADPHFPSPRPLSGVTGRAVLIGSLLALGNTWWVIFSDTHGRDSGTALPLFITPIFYLFLLTLLNLWLRRFGPRWTFSTGELLTIYFMPVVTTSLAAHDMIQNFFGLIGYAAWGATPENRWESLFGRRLPPWLVIADREALKGFYEGGKSLYDPQNYRFWLAPLACWAVFTFVLMGTLLCLAVLVRRRWTEQERLSFPVIQLPLHLARPGPFFRDGLMWLGFGLMLAIGLLQQLHRYVPVIPTVPPGVGSIRRIDTELPGWPWNRMGPTWIGAEAFAVGLAYFIPLELIFSCWMFYVLRKLLEVGAVWLAGSGKATDFPYINEQACGAWIAMGMLALWSAKEAIQQAGRDLVRGRFRWEGGDPLPISLALLGGLAGLLFLAWFSAQAGLGLGTFAGFFGVYFLLALAISRVRAELGPPHEIYFVNPLRVLVTLLGSDRLGPQNLTICSLYYWFNRCYRPHPMPNYLEAFKLSDYFSVNKTRLIGVLLGAAVLGIGGSYWAHLHLSYAEGSFAKLIGFSRWGGLEAWNWLANWLQNPQEIEGSRLTALGFGAALTGTLKLLRSRFLWWPLHPAGYALAISYAMEYFWFAFLLTWLVKGLIVRYFGMKGQRRGIAFFLGLILGDYTRRAIMLIIDPLVLP